MLDQNDLQQIAKLLDQKFEEHFESAFLKQVQPLGDAVRLIVREEIAPIKSDVGELKRDVEYVKGKANSIYGQLDILETRLDRIKDMLEKDINRTMKDIENVDKRLVVLESNLNQASEKVAVI